MKQKEAAYEYEGMFDDLHRHNGTRRNVRCGLYGFISHIPEMIQHVSRNV